MSHGFLLTRHWQDTRDGIRLDFWLATDDGAKLVSVHLQQAVFFIPSEHATQAANLLQTQNVARISTLDLHNFQQQPVSGVYFNAQQQVYRARDILKQHNIPCYEADIRPTERFLSERFITGPVTFDAGCTGNPRLNPGSYTPRFKIMSIDIESDFETAALFSIAFVSGETRKTLMIGELESTDLVEYVTDESTLLNSWINWLEALDPDILIGWNVINFDLQQLQQRAQKLNIALRIGRNRSIPVWRKAQSENGHFFISIPGRVVLDGIDTLKSATYSFTNFTLENVAQEILGRGKLIAQTARHDPLFKAKQIRQQFHHDKPALAAYNLEDCQLVADIFTATKLIDFAIQRARLTGLEMDRVGGSVAAFENLYLPRLHRKGFVAPNIGDYQGKLSAPGGYVMNSKPGMYDSVLVLDYKSLYPSIIRTFKVDPYARIAALRDDCDEIVPGFDGASFSIRDNILPDMIATLWLARDQAKQQKNAPLSQAIKIIMNSFYGVLGTPGCRLHDSRLTSSITKRSHEIILRTAQIIEAEGYDVIYGDTDSVFVSLKQACSNSTAGRIGNSLVTLVNRFWRDHLQQQYAIPSYLEMEFETHFQQFFMPTVRGSDQGSKKRYAGLVDDELGNRIIHYKGLESVRTDWTELARNFQRELYRLVFAGEAYSDYIQDTVASLYAGQFDHQLVYRKRLRKKLAEYVKNIPTHAQAAIKAEAGFKQSAQPSRYRNKSWIEYVITTAGPETLETQCAALDYEHYIEKQLTPIADTILTVIGSSMEAVTGRQQELF